MHPAFTTPNLNRITRLDWMNQAACAKPLPPKLTPANWYPQAHQGNATPVRNALKICATCPVRGDCLVDALINDRWRVWGIIRGGYTSRTRRNLRAALQRAGTMPLLRQCAICGTWYTPHTTGMADRGRQPAGYNVRSIDARCSPTCRKKRIPTTRRIA